MKRFNRILFRAWAMVLAGLFLVNVLVAVGGQGEKADPVHLIMENYFAMGQTLAQDSFKGINQNAKKIAKAASQILKEEKGSSAEKKEYFQQVKAIQGTAQEFVSKDLKSARESYKALSDAVNKFVKTYGYSSTTYSFYCPMVEQTWFQSTDQIANPFYGSEMLKCGKMTGMVKEGKYLEKSKVESGHKH